MARRLLNPPRLGYTSTSSSQAFQHPGSKVSVNTPRSSDKKTPGVSSRVFY